MIKKLYIAWKREGFIDFIKLATHRLKKLIFPIFICPITVPIALFIFIISPWVYIRLIMLFSDRIGHFAYNTELLLCVLDKLNENKYKYKNFFYTVPGAPICNTQLYRMWKRIITILPFPYIWREVDNLLICFGGKKYTNDPLKKFFGPAGGVWDQWNLFMSIKKCHIDFTTSEERRGKALLNKLGIPDNAQFICIHGRDSLYLKIHRPDGNWSYHDYRNVSINNYREAALFLADKGYYVIRMGKHVEEAFNVKHPYVIDYASSNLQSDFMDIYLSAKCFFFISVSSGLDEIPHIFRKPILQTNLTLADTDYPLDWYLIILKKIIDTKTGTILPFKKIEHIFSNALRKKLIVQTMNENKLCFIENTPEEIREATSEILNRLTNNYNYSEEDEHLQDKFWQSFNDPRLKINNIPLLQEPKIATDLFSVKNGFLRIGNDFLKQNASWLVDTI